MLSISIILLCNFVMSFYLYFATVFVLGEKRKVRVLFKVVSYSISLFFSILWLPFSFYSIAKAFYFLKTDWTGVGIMKMIEIKLHILNFMKIGRPNIGVLILCFSCAPILFLISHPIYLHLCIYHLQSSSTVLLFNT